MAAAGEEEEEAAAAVVEVMGVGRGVVEAEAGATTRMVGVAVATEVEEVIVGDQAVVVSGLGSILAAAEAEDQASDPRGAVASDRGVVGAVEEVVADTIRTEAVEGEDTAVEDAVATTVVGSGRAVRRWAGDGSKGVGGRWKMGRMANLILFFREILRLYCVSFVTVYES